MPDTVINSNSVEVKRKIISSLKKISLFAGLYDEEFIPLCDICSGRTIKQGDYFFKEEDHSRSMFVLLSGKVTLSTKKKNSIYEPKPGEVFGEMGLITQNLRSATAQASTDCTVLEISNADYNMLLGKHPRISSIIMRHIAEILAQHIIRMNSHD